MPEPAIQSELLQSLGRLTRGLSALFWGLPAALVASVQAATGAWLGLPATLNHLAPTATFALLLYGLGLMGGFQRQERIWIASLDQARLLALTALGLSPFLLWHQRLPNTPLFASAVLLLALCSVLLLFCLNRVLRRLAAMLPDETLRQETAAFTAVNSWMLLILPSVAAAWFLALRAHDALPVTARQFLQWLEPARLLILLFFALLPVSITMSLLWKIKEAILECVFSEPAGHPPHPAPNPAATNPRPPPHTPS